MNQEEQQEIHRQHAILCNNRAWDLSAELERSIELDQEMLTAAYTAYYHWSQIGTPINIARAEMLMAHVHSLTESPEEAIFYAQRCCNFFQQESKNGSVWDVAFSQAELAYAYAISGNHDKWKHFRDLAVQLSQQLEDQEDLKIFKEEFQRIQAHAEKTLAAR